MALPNILATEPLLIARLTAAVPAFAIVADLSALQAGEALTASLPAAYLADGGAAPAPGSAMVANRIVEEQEWAVRVYAAYARDGATDGAWLAAAGDLLAGVYEALHGWRAGNGARFLYARREPAQYTDGYVQSTVYFRAAVTFDWPE